MPSEVRDTVSIIELPEDEFFLFIDGNAPNPRVMIRTGDIKNIEFPNGDDLVLTIKTWNDTYIYHGLDASVLEEFLLARKSYGGT